MPPMSTDLSNPTLIAPQNGSTLEPISPTEVPKDVLNELLLIFSVIGSTTTSSKNSLSKINDPIDTNIIPVSDCLNWLQDLQRALRRDDDTHRPISILLAHWRMVEHKLIPLAISCKYDTAIVMTITKILVILTKPMNGSSRRAARMVLNPKATESAIIKEQITLRENGIKQSEMLMQYKKLIVQHDSAVRRSRSKRKGSNDGGKSNTFLSIIVSLLSEPLARTGSARTDSDHLTIELVLHLIRNLLNAEPVMRVSAEDAEKSITLHRQLIYLFEQEHVLDIILVLSQDMEARENSHYNLLLMEILNSLIREEDADMIVQSVHKSQGAGCASLNLNEKGNKHKNKKGKTQVTSGILSLLRNEKRNSVATPNRHSHFGGMLSLQTSTGKKRVISTNRIFGSNSSRNKSNDSIIPAQKPRRKNVKHNAFIGSKQDSSDQMKNIIMSNINDPLYSKYRNALYTFSTQFLEKAYGPLMKSLKNEFRRESSRLEASDKLLFFKIVRFFSGFGRVARKYKKSHRKGPEAGDADISDNSAIGPLVFTMDIFSFSLLFKAIVSYHDHKKYLELAQACKLYKEMMFLLYEMSTSKDETENDMALGLMDRLYYSNEPTDLIGKLFSWWKPGVGTRAYLADLVELQHVSLKQLSHFAKGNQIESEERQSKRKKLNIGQNHGDLVARIREDAEEFDVNSYFGKLVSNHSVYMYTMILAEYQSNSPQVNHHIIAFFTRMCKFLIFAPNSDEYEMKELKLRKTTYEPMLYNIHLLSVFSKILSDVTIRDKKEYSLVLHFSAMIIRHFGLAAQENDMLFIESLFRFPHPHRVCEMVNNHYVSEELVMIGERERLLESAREEEDENWTETNANTNEEQDKVHEISKKDLNDSSDEELEFNETFDEEKNDENKDGEVSISDYIEAHKATNSSKTGSKTKKIKKRKRIQKLGNVSQDDSDDDDDAFGSSSFSKERQTFKSSNVFQDDE